MPIDTRSRPRQVAQQVLRYINTNKLVHGDRLPSEMEMARRLGVSRNTVREAYISMEREGIILRKHGLGTIVVRSSLVDTLHSARLHSYHLMIRSAGYTPTITNLKRNQVPAPADAAEAFGLQRSEDLLCVSRVIVADGVPAVYVVDYFAPEIREEDLNWDRFDGDMIDFMSLSFGAREFQYHSRIGAEIPGSEMASLLEVANGAPIVVTKSTLYVLEDLKALVYTINYLNPSVINLHVSGRLMGST